MVQGIAITTGNGKYEQLLERCEKLEAISTAVVHPCEGTGLSGAIEAAEKGLIIPILIGPREKIQATARTVGIDLRPFEIVDAPHSQASAMKAVELLREAKAELLMKGSLHTDKLMAAVVSREGGLRTGRRISHVFVMDVPTYHKVLIVTDGAINIAPTLEDKVDICQNAIDLAISLGRHRPKVAILAAVETVTSKMPATIDAAAIDTSSIQFESDEIRGRAWADDGAIACCVSPMLVGKQMQFFGARANLAKCLLYAINGGRDEITGEQIAPMRGDVRGDHLDFDDVAHKFEGMMDWLAGVYVNAMNIIHYMHDNYAYERIEMALHDYAPLRTMAFGMAGLSVVADSLSAMKYAKVRVIRDETGLVTDYETKGEFPKFGNNDNRVDHLAAWVVSTFMTMLK